MTIGIDEVGRGSWAGPLVVAAVGLDIDIPGLADSKVLSISQRLRLALLIRSQATFIRLAWVPSPLVDSLGLTASMKAACQSLYDDFPHHDGEIVIDGHINYLPGTVARALIDADATTPAVSAASIIAKVARDRYMQMIAQTYPKYGFERHVGYGTSAHRQAIETYGICAIHRRRFRPIAMYTAQA